MGKSCRCYKVKHFVVLLIANLIKCELVGFMQTYKIQIVGSFNLTLITASKYNL